MRNGVDYFERLKNADPAGLTSRSISSIETGRSIHVRVQVSDDQANMILNMLDVRQVPVAVVYLCFTGIRSLTLTSMARESKETG